jgi:hypothetical protein
MEIAAYCPLGSGETMIKRFAKFDFCTFGQAPENRSEIGLTESSIYRVQSTVCPWMMISVQDFKTEG